MAEDLGNVVKPNLKSCYMGVKYDPRATGFTGMSSATEVEAFDVDAPEVGAGSPDTNEVPPDELGTAKTDNSANADGHQPGASQADDAGGDAGAVRKQPDGGLRGERGQREPNGTEPVRQPQKLGQAELPASDDSRGGPATGARADQRNYRIQPGELKRTGSWKATAEQNVKLVELVKQILSENRQATPEEKTLLTKFTGWGASEIANGVFPNQFGRYKDQTWQDLGGA
ncbi:hypothetical protein D3C87_1269170 [compost metagenome]|uniref:hypothetical protein n=1 Tax=Pseudomonas sp. BF-R-19 TaxID=2832397 RepID=UPI000FC3A103|nr:hypothetical protein [Pseudomonas sp. BF-R-19]